VSDDIPNRVTLLVALSFFDDAITAAGLFFLLEKCPYLGLQSL
jgi:hypothetical protein